MKKFYRNSLIVISCLCFLALSASPAGAQANGKKTPPPAQQQAKKQMIVNVTAARVRSEPAYEAETLQQAEIGTVFTVLETSGDWSKVKLAGDRAGWISKSVTEDFLPANRIKIYGALADKYLARKNLDFKTGAEVFYFLKKAGAETASAELELRRFQMLEKTLDLIPLDKKDEEPFKTFTEKNRAEIVYSDPAGQWYVNAKSVWQLHAGNKNKPVGEEIAWQAVKIPLPGECEGYVNCYIYTLRATDGEYLNFYPAGKHSREALKNITDFLEPISADAARKQVYSGPVDISDRAELNKYLAELRTIVSKTPYVEKQKTIGQINRIAEAFK